MGVIQNSLNSIVGSGLKVAGAAKLKEIAGNVESGAKSLQSQDKSLIAMQKSQESINNKFNSVKALQSRIEQLEQQVSTPALKNINQVVGEIDTTGYFGDTSNMVFEDPNRGPTDDPEDYREDIYPKGKGGKE